MTSTADDYKSMTECIEHNPNVKKLKKKEKKIKKLNKKIQKLEKQIEEMQAQIKKRESLYDESKENDTIQKANTIKNRVVMFAQKMGNAVLKAVPSVIRTCVPMLLRAFLDRSKNKKRKCLFA